MAQTYKIKGQEFQHAKLQLVFAFGKTTFESVTFTKADWKDGAPKKVVRDKFGNIDGYTIGERETDGNFTMRRGEWLKLKQAVAQQFPDKGIGQVEFTAMLYYGNSIADLAGKDEIDFLFNEEKFASESNQEAHMIDLPLCVLAVRPKEGEFIKYDA